MGNVKLRFKASMPTRLENALAARGFTYCSQKAGKWIIYERVPDDDLDNSGVPKAVQLKLKARLEKIIDAFVDPYAYQDAIRAQCIKVAETLPELQGKWVLEWVSKNIDNEFFSPPWEDEDHMYNC